jgi:hypothetical protein
MGSPKGPKDDPRTSRQACRHGDTSCDSEDITVWDVHGTTVW